MQNIFYLKPSSFCFGVKRSIDELTKIIEQHPKSKIFCIHALVHNPKITDYFQQMGVEFVESLDEVKKSHSVVVFSAHGINRQKLEEVQNKFKFVYNLECPFVSKIYHEIESFLAKGIRNFVYIGKNGHQEAKNVMENITFKGGQVFNLIDKKNINQIPFVGEFAILSQTTLNFGIVQNLIKDIQKQFPSAIVPKQSDICKATYERQGVIKKHKDKFENLIVIGGKESSNTKELCEIGKNEGKNVFFAESFDDLLLEADFISQKKGNVAVTGGASTPIEDILKVIDRYKGQGYNYEVLEF